jgi:hypothetical protein
VASGSVVLTVFWASRSSTVASRVPPYRANQPFDLDIYMVLYPEPRKVDPNSIWTSSMTASLSHTRDCPSPTRSATA